MNSKNGIIEGYPGFENSYSPFLSQESWGLLLLY